MPVYHITLHAYRSWSPDHPRGYTRRGKGYQKPDPEQARKRLAEEKERVKGELAEHEQPDTSGEPEDSGDEANDLEQASTDSAFVEDLKRTLEEIEKAEARLDDGTYGKSVVSGDPIPDERLEASPTAELTIEEQERRPS